MGTARPPYPRPVPLRTLVAVLVLLLLLRAGRVAWRQRALLRAVWAAISWRHLLGSVGLLAVVVLTAGVLLATIPGMGLGLGSLLGTHGNAVFTPLEEGLALTGPAPVTGPDWPLLVGATLFLGLLTLLLPWLAFVEEELFRAGLEVASWPRVIVASTVFGLVHLVMLVPLAAALAIGVAGFGYAVIYRRAHAEVRPTPTVARAAYHPTRRADHAATRAVEDPWAAVVWRDAQAAGVFHAAVWHTTVNTLIVVVVWLSIVAIALG